MFTTVKNRNERKTGKSKSFPWRNQIYNPNKTGESSSYSHRIANILSSKGKGWGEKKEEEKRQGQKGNPDLIRINYRGRREFNNP